ncbi:MAG TPA: NADH-quinone oxidoreductase subunit C [Candidatus Polarisedimenticolia bacterium]|nr:NADH-quinone oxidoreductase subunit C [Candidatus Polarisedimenticolia bacterium]
MVAGPYIEPAPPAFLLDRLRERFPGAILEVGEFRGEITVIVPKERIAEIALYLRDDPEADFDMLSDLTGLHYLDREYDYEVVYHLRSLARNHRLRLKVRLVEREAVPSVTPVWPAANWQEREAFDLVGIRFQGHPDLRRIIMPEDYQAHPLRKDFDVEGGPTSIDAPGRPASPGFRDLEHA